MKDEQTFVKHGHEPVVDTFGEFKLFNPNGNHSKKFSFCDWETKKTSTIASALKGGSGTACQEYSNKMPSLSK